MPVLTRRQSQILRPSYDLMSGLRVWLPFDDNTARNYSPLTNYNGTFSSTPPFVQGPVRNTNGSSGAIKLTGQYVSISELVFYQIYRFTFSMWVNTSSYPGTGAQAGLFRSWKAGQQDIQISTYNNGTRTYYAFSMYNIGGGVGTTGSIPLNTWQHLAAVYDGSYQYLYVNGVLSGSAATSGTPAYVGGSTAYIGGFPGTSAPFYGSIDDFRYYNRVLSPGEINMLYSSAFQPQFVEPTYQLPTAVTHSAPNADVTVGGWTGG